MTPATLNSAASVAARPLFALALRLGSVVTLALMFTAVILAEREGVSIIESLFWRQLAGLPVVLLWLAASGRLREIRTARPMAHATRMVMGVSAMGLNYWSFTLLPMAEATTIGFAVPLFATAFAALLLGEATGRWRWGAVVAGFVGVLIVLQPGSSVIDPLGAGVALAAALATALVTIQIRYLGRTEATGAIVFWFSLSSLIPLGLLLPLFAVDHGPAAWGYVALLSIAGAISQLLMTASLRFGAVAAVLTMDYTMLIWALLIGWVLFGQLPAAATWLSAPLIVAAGLVIAWREHRAHGQTRGRAAAVAPE